MEAILWNVTLITSTGKAYQGIRQPLLYSMYSRLAENVIPSTQLELLGDEFDRLEEIGIVENAHCKNVEPAEALEQEMYKCYFRWSYLLDENQFNPGCPGYYSRTNYFLFTANIVISSACCAPSVNCLICS